MRVVVARAAREALAGALSLRARGFDASAFEGLTIKPCLSEAQRFKLLERLGEARSLMYVSANAVEAFWGSDLMSYCPLVTRSIEFDATKSIVSAHPLMHWATGPSTAQALTQMGIAPATLRSPTHHHPKSPIDSEALWAVVGPEVGGWIKPATVWIIRGRDGDGQIGRPWLADQLQAQGIDVVNHIAYERVLPELKPDVIEQAKASFARADVWVFANGQVLQHLMRSVGFTADERASVRVLTTHPSIAQLAKQLGLIQVDDGCAGHSVDEWVQSLQSLHEPRTGS